MGRRARALVLAAAVAVGGVVAVAVPAGAVTGSFAATCVTTGGIHGPLTEHRAIAYEIHAPDSVAPGAVLDVPITFDFAIPANAQVGGAIIDFGGTAQASIVAAPGATEVTGTVRVPTDGPPGSAVPIRIHDLVAATTIGGNVLGEICTPDHTTVLAQVGIGVPLVSIGDGAIVEGTTGTRGLQFPVTLSRAAATSVSVTFGVESGTATSGADYTTQSGSVTIPAGHVTGIATVRVRGDATVETTENFRVRLVGPSGAAIGRGVGTGRIIDDDPPTGLRISIGDSGVVEGARGTRSARFVVSLSAAAPQDVTFHYTTVDGSAVAGVDYRAQSFDYGIPAGHTSISVPVPVVADTTPEPSRTFTVRLTTAGGATIGRATGVGTIFDDD